jgi:N-dimethylarginine dimethylaminohydrolase
MRLLMCPPSYYGIEYEINPWMKRSRQSDRALAVQQWAELSRVLAEKLPAEIHLIDPKPGLPDMVFTANAGVVWGNKFIVSNFRYVVRKGEASHFARWFRARGWDVVHLPEEYYFEGEGDLLRCGDVWFAGYHIRSDMLAHQKVAEIIDSEILSLELTSDWFYHLDTCFCPLAPGVALYFPDAFDAYGQRVLSTHVPKLIAVAEAEAHRFGCNAVVVGKTVVHNSRCPRMTADLARAGYKSIEVELDEFLKAGGSAKCLTLRLDGEEAAAWRTVADEQV